MSRICLLFPGQGSQAIGMGKSFFENDSFAKESIQIASDTLGLDFNNIINSEKIDLTQYSQPAILLLSYIIFNNIKKRVDINPVLAIGHSLGEISAITCANGLELKDAIELVHKRGLLMQEACEGKDGSMLAVIGLDDEKADRICAKLRDENREIWIANYNCDGQLVISGKKDDLIASQDILKAEGAKKSLLLNMSVASHSPMLESITSRFSLLLEKSLKDKFDFPVASNSTTNLYSTKSEALELLTKQLISPVLYKHSIKKFEDDVDVFIELGHGGVLKSINKRVTKKPTYHLESYDKMDDFLNSIKS